MSSDMIRADSLSFSYPDGARIFDSLDLVVSEGERVCLFAPSGGGKTTLLRLIGGLLRPTSGELTVNAGRRISTVFQENRLLPFKTVAGNVDLFATVPPARTRVILGLLGLSDALDLYPGDLSGGMARRAALARALCREADLYLFDEPFAGLDEKSVGAAVGAIDGVVGRRTAVFVLHDLGHAGLLGCRIIELP